jgi:hypothetical protein
MADKIKVTVNTSELVRAIRDYEKYSSRSMPEIINGTAVDVAFKANQSVKSAKVGAIKKADQDGKLWHALAASGASRFGKTVKGQGNKEAAQRILSARNSARGYSKALFLKMAQDLGKTIKSALGRGLPGNSAAKKAKEALICYAELTVEGIEKSHADTVIGPAMQAGVDKAAKAKRDRISKKLSDAAKKHSGRRAR